MVNEANFDELSKKAFETNAGEDFEKLFGAVFSLSEWHFIRNGESPRYFLYPEMFGEQPAVAVFTDAERAGRYNAEKGLNLSSADSILSISTVHILDYIEQLITNGIFKIFFNPDKNSHGFHNDLKMMRPIYEHLENKGLLAKTGTNAVQEHPATLAPQAKNDIPAEQAQADIDAEMQPSQLTKLLEENAELIADFDKENELLSAILAGTAAAMDEAAEEDKARIVSDTANMFESVRIEYNMSPKLFRIYIESCLNKRKFLMPVLAFAYLQQDNTKCEKLEQDKEFVNEYADWMTRKMVPAAEVLMGEPAQKSAAPSEKEGNETTDESKNSPVESQTPTAPFDELSRKAFATNAIEDLNSLFDTVYALENWLFIARGEMPNVSPYIASNAEVAGGQQMVRAFTDSDRLQRFARENNLTEGDGSALVLAIPTANVIEYLEQFIPHGVHGIWFNSDSQSEGFFISLGQLRPIREHLSKLKPPQKPSVATLLVQVKDGLMLPSGFVSQAEYFCNFFCRVPSAWLEGENLKENYLEKIYEKFYGEMWRAGNSDGSRYVMIDSYTKVFPPETVKETKFSGTENTKENKFWFYIGNETGEIKSATADEFQSDIDADLQVK